MDKLVIVLLCISSMVIIFNQISVIIAYCRNKKYYDRKRKAYKGLMIITIIINLLMCVGYCYIFFNAITGKNVYSIFSALLMLLGALLMFLFLHTDSTGNRVVWITEQTELIKGERDALLNNISHEIRTPMNVIIGTTEVLKRNDFNDTIRESLYNISDAGKTLLTIVNNVIDFSKLDSGTMKLIENDYKVLDMLDSILSNVYESLKDSKVELFEDIDDTIPSVLMGDEERVKQVVSGILSNAVKFTEAGIITFRVKWRRDGIRAVLLIDVEDTGIGIDKSDQEKIFNSFQKIETKKEKTVQGMGLGLMIARNLIRLMHGKISFHSEKDEGTVFNIEIPQIISNTQPIGKYSNKNKKGVSKRYSFNAPMARVLIVDDNMVNLFVAKEILEDYKMEITTASSGEECLKMTKENYYDIIFMDHIMPVLDGVDTLHMLRRQNEEHSKKIPVVALTANVLSGSEKTYENEGFQGFLSKPIDIGELEKILIRLLPEEYICRKEPDNLYQKEEFLRKDWYKRFCRILENADIKTGLSFCKNEYTTYINLLKVIHNDGFGKSLLLREYIEKGDYETYTITVHALKSVSASAGEKKLSDMAFEHEKAGREKNEQFIKNNIESLINEYETFLGQVDTLLEKETQIMGGHAASEKREGTREEINSIINRLIEYLEDFNIDDAEECINELFLIKLSANQERELIKVREKLSTYKYEEAAHLLEGAFRKED